MSSKLVASQIATLQQPHLPWEVDQKLGHKSPPVRVTSYHLIKVRAKQCPTTLQGGSGHDPPREREITSHLLRQNKSGDCSQSHSVCCCPTRRLDDEETWDELTSEGNRVVKCSAEIIRFTPFELNQFKKFSYCVTRS